MIIYAVQQCAALFFCKKSKMKKSPLILMLVSCLIASGLITAAYVLRTQKWPIAREPAYPLEKWEVGKQWKIDGRQFKDIWDWQPMPDNMRGEVVQKSTEWWLYRNKALGFEMEFPARGGVGMTDFFETLIDEFSYNKSYEIELGSKEKLIHVEVRGTRFRSLEEWAANIPDLTPRSLERWTIISGMRALIIRETGLQEFSGEPLTFEQIRRFLYIIKDKKLYILSTMYISENDYQKILDSFKFL